MYEMKPLTCDPGSHRVLSERMILSHYENNYGGAVKRLNQILEYLSPVALIASEREESPIDDPLNG